MPALRDWEGASADGWAFGAVRPLQVETGAETPRGASGRSDDVSVPPPVNSVENAARRSSPRSMGAEVEARFDAASGSLPPGAKGPGLGMPALRDGDVASPVVDGPMDLGRPSQPESPAALGVQRSIEAISNQADVAPAAPAPDRTGGEKTVAAPRPVDSVESATRPSNSRITGAEIEARSDAASGLLPPGAEGPGLGMPALRDGDVASPEVDWPSDFGRPSPPESPAALEVQRSLEATPRTRQLLLRLFPLPRGSAPRERFLLR